MNWIENGKSRKSGKEDSRYETEYASVRALKEFAYEKIYSTEK
jgi:hypothetical protein